MVEASKTYKKKTPHIGRQGKGVYQDVVNATNRLIGSKAPKLLDGNYGLVNQVYTGPGTPIDQYIKEGIKPINKTDECSMHHDVDYTNAMNIKDPKERAKMIRFADEKVKDCYSSIKDEPFYSTVAKTGITIKNAFEDAIPSIAKKYEKNYYGSVTGGDLLQGNAKKILHKSLYK